MSEYTEAEINTGLLAVDEAKRAHGPGNWDCLADFGLRPSSFIAYAKQQGDRLATHADAFSGPPFDGPRLDTASFTTGWLDGLLCGIAIAQARRTE